MELAHAGVPLVDPGVAGSPVLAHAGAPAEVAARAELEHRVVVGVEGEGEAVVVRVARGRGHDGGVEHGDEGPRREFAEAGEGRGEEVEVEGPFEVGEGEDHVFAALVGRAFGGFGEGGFGVGGGGGGGCDFILVFMGEGGGLGGDDGEDYDVG